MIKIDFIHDIERLFKRVFIIFSLSLLGCANMPEAIQSSTESTISVQAVQQNATSYKGQFVRWGGVITQVINNENDTWIEVLSLELSGSGRPSSNRKKNQGRFIAKINQFLDPEVYEEGLSLTVIGLVNDKIDGKIGEYNYSFPVVETQGHHLWSKRTYHYYQPVTPGYWYYGFHPFWNFGYRYYGYGVLHHPGYFPYYPFYGHLQRRTRPLERDYKPKVYNPVDHQFWRAGHTIPSTRGIKGPIKRDIPDTLRYRQNPQSASTSRRSVKSVTNGRTKTTSSSSRSKKMPTPRREPPSIKTFKRPEVK